jgi:hypothetical protein
MSSSVEELSRRDRMTYELIREFQPHAKVYVERGKIYVDGEPLNRKRPHRVSAG